MWAVLGDVVGRFLNQLMNVEGFVTDIQFMSSEFRTPSNSSVETDTLRKNQNLGRKIRIESMHRLWYNVGRAIYNGVKHPKESDIMDSIDDLIQKLAREDSEGFSADLSWNFDEKSCEMMREGKWTELFDSWNSTNWQQYSKCGAIL